MNLTFCNVTAELEKSERRRSTMTLAIHHADSIGSTGSSCMAWLYVPPDRPGPFCDLWRDSGAHILPSNVPARDALLQAIPATTVRTSRRDATDQSTDDSQHHPDTLHGPNLFCSFLPILLLLPTFNLLRSAPRLLRSVRHCKLLCVTLPLHCERLA